MPLASVSLQSLLLINMLLLKFFLIFILFLLILNHAEGVRKRKGKKKNVEQIPSNPEADIGEGGDEKQKGKIVEVIGEEKDKGTPSKTYASVLLSEAPKAPKIPVTGQSSNRIPPKIGQKPSQNPPSTSSNPKGVHHQFQSPRGGMPPHFLQPKYEKVGMHPKNSQDKIQNTQQHRSNNPQTTEGKKLEATKRPSPSQPPPKRGNIIAVADPTLEKAEGEETSSDAQRNHLESQNNFQKSSKDSQKDGFTIQIGSFEVKIPKAKIEQKTNSESSISENDKKVDLNKGKEIEVKDVVNISSGANISSNSEIPMDKIKQGFNSESSTSKSVEKEELDKGKQIEEDEDLSSNSDTSETTSSSDSSHSVVSKRYR
uniref:Uncharacterized protein n=1 Tax=Meloidogyne javanica TaxID=6303 RepID=A0A915LBU0_MELJA